MDTANIRTQLLDALLKGDRRTVLQLFDDALLEGHSVRELKLRVIEGAQRRVGELSADANVPGAPLPIVVGGPAALGQDSSFADLALSVVHGDARAAYAEAQRLLGVS